MRCVRCLSARLAPMHPLPRRGECSQNSRRVAPGLLWPQDGKTALDLAQKEGHVAVAQLLEEAAGEQRADLKLPYGVSAKREQVIKPFVQAYH